MARKALASTVNVQGQITQYRYGNASGTQVTTVNTYNATSNRMSASSATKDGAASGNVFSQTYLYDALSNMTVRADNQTGVQDYFTYDNLNRLTQTSSQGGGISPTRTTQVLYDERGNIQYKSDVGHYWYDSARPNRMTNVTLDNSVGGAIALTGTRTWSYAFDDNKPGAQNVGGTSFGNGNLEYTVSHDTVNSRHTVRSETYTSYNMPGQIVFGNFITNTTSTADRQMRTDDLIGAPVDDDLGPSHCFAIGFGRKPPGHIGDCDRDVQALIGRFLLRQPDTGKGGDGIDRTGQNPVIRGTGWPMHDIMANDLPFIGRNR